LEGEEEIAMNMQVYNAAFKDELEKIASDETITRLTGGAVAGGNALHTKFLFDQLKGGPKSRIAARILLPLNLAAITLGLGMASAPRATKKFLGHEKTASGKAIKKILKAGKKTKTPKKKLEDEVKNYYPKKPKNAEKSLEDKVKGYYL
jgi:hypothetical protein